jgi:acyl-CoA reductase-like NAD-dependent aldehyde dehydrogenase
VFRLQPLIDGAWVDAQSGKTMPVVDPRTEEVVLLLLLLPLLCR